jgi:hypothetical protein
LWEEMCRCLSEGGVFSESTETGPWIVPVLFRLDIRYVPDHFSKRFSAVLLQSRCSPRRHFLCPSSPSHLKTSSEPPSCSGRLSRSWLFAVVAERSSVLFCLRSPAVVGAETADISLPCTDNGQLEGTSDGSWPSSEEKGPHGSGKGCWKTRKSRTFRRGVTKARHGPVGLLARSLGSRWMSGIIQPQVPHLFFPAWLVSTPVSGVVLLLEPAEIGALWGR